MYHSEDKLGWCTCCQIKTMLNALYLFLQTLPGVSVINYVYKHAFLVTL